MKRGAGQQGAKKRGRTRFPWGNRGNFEPFGGPGRTMDYEESYPEINPKGKGKGKGME